MTDSNDIALRPIRLAAPSILVALGFAVTFLFWQSLVAGEERQMHHELSTDVQVMKTLLGLDMQEGGFDPAILFQPAFLAPAVSIAVRRGNQLLFSRGIFDPQTSSWKETATLKMYGSLWQIDVQPSMAFLHGHRSWLSKAVLIGGLLVSLLMALAMMLAQDARRRAHALAKAQRQLRKAHSVLEVKVEERTQALRQALDALSQENAERMRSEQALHESVARFRAMSDASPLGIFVTDIEGNCVYSNPRFQALAGLSNEEITGRSWEQFLNEEDRLVVTKTWSQAMRSYRTYENTQRFMRPDKQEIWTAIKAAPIHDGLSFSGYVGVVEDITERRAGERQLADSERRYRALADAIPQMVWTAGPEGSLDYYNQRWCDYTGMTSEQTQIEGWKAVLHPDDFDLCAQQWHHSVETGGVFQIEYRLKHVTDGAYRWFLGQALPWHDATGKIMKWFGSCTDIEDQKRLQMELVDAKQAAETAARAKSNFLANISHEIRTPINGIIGTTGLLAETVLNAEQQEFVEILHTSSDALLTIVNDLLDLSKIEAGKLTLEQGNVDLHRTVESAIVLFSERLHFKKIELATFFSAHLPAVVKGDAIRIRQVLINLLGNAIKYTETGGITLSLEPELAPDPTGGRLLRFEITDTGIGMSEAQQASLFQPFYQADSSASRAYGGTGLGLAISKQLVQMMGGSIGFKSEVNKGSTFWFKVPLEAAAEQPVNWSLLGKRILVVEGPENSRAALMHQLANWHAETEMTAEGKKALSLLVDAAAQQKPFDVVLTDWHLSDMEGLKFAESVEKNPQLQKTHVVMMASLARHLWKREAEAAHISAFVNKPLLYSQLYSVLSGIEQEPAEKTRGTVFHEPQSKRRRGTGHLIRILLAEDNLVNQTVAVRQLERMGYACDSVSNGREALAATVETEYDLVLMDLQMPEMDGYEATAEIRRREPARKHLIIVAMTAHALKEDLDRCLAAGMDDYIRKPVKPAALAATLEKWAPSISDTERVSSNPATHSPNSLVPEDKMDFIDKEQFIATLGSEDSDNGSLLKLYLDSTAKHLSELSAAATQSDWGIVERIAHSSAGANAMVGMNEMARLLRSIERDAREGDHSQATQWLLELNEEFQRIEQLLKEKTNKTFFPENMEKTEIAKGSSQF